MANNTYNEQAILDCAAEIDPALADTLKSVFKVQKILPNASIADAVAVIELFNSAAPAPFSTPPTP